MKKMKSPEKSLALTRPYRKKVGSKTPQMKSNKGKTTSQRAVNQARGNRTLLRQRLNKYLSQHGLTSRRKADEWIREGRVQVNGVKVFSLGVTIDPQKDQVKVDGKKIPPKPHHIYLVFNKPKYVVTTTRDPLKRPIIMDFFKSIKTRLFPVGRLDWDTEGMILITNDGDFSNEITHPKSNIHKTYQAKLSGIPTPEQMNRLQKGVRISGVWVKPLELKRLRKRPGNQKISNKKEWVEIKIKEGKNRQIHKMFEKIGFNVIKLKRVSIGQLKLGRLKSGAYRPLEVKDLEKIFS